MDAGCVHVGFVYHFVLMLLHWLVPVGGVDVGVVFDPVLDFAVVAAAVAAEGRAEEGIIDHHHH